MATITAERSFKMCICEGTGGINIEKVGVLEFHPCPDTKCDFDKDKFESDRAELKRRWGLND